MKAVILSLALIFGVAAVATFLAPNVAMACNPGSPGCGPN